MKIDTSNPWKTLRSEEVFDSPWIKLTRHDVINPGGNPGVYSVVHFKNYAIGIIPLDQDQNTWLVGQYRYSLNLFTWEIPEGGGKLELPPLESAKRELLEETGITARRWQLIQTMHLSNSVTDELCFLYLAQELSFSEPEPDDTEKLFLKKIPFNNLYQQVVNGEITDSLSVTATLRLKLMMMNGEL